MGWQPHSWPDVTSLGIIAVPLVDARRGIRTSNISVWHRDDFQQIETAMLRSAIGWYRDLIPIRQVKLLRVHMTCCSVHSFQLRRALAAAPRRPEGEGGSGLGLGPTVARRRGETFRPSPTLPPSAAALRPLTPILPLLARDCLCFAARSLLRW
eukprot:COSAG02_NODE_2141_length_9686_cov_3.045791_9_plen_154_part_00